MFSASIVDAWQFEVVGRKVSGACRGGNPRTRWWTPEYLPLEWQTGVVVPLFKSGGPESVFQLQRDHTSQPPRKVYARVLERRIRPIVEPSDSGGTMRFSWPLVVEQWTSSLYPPQGARGFMGVCPTSPHVLCGSGEGIRPCPSWYSVGSAPHEYGVRGPLLRAVRSLYDRSRSLEFALPAMMLSCWLLQARTFSMCWSGLQRFAAECEAAGMRISTSKSEAMVPGIEKVEKGGVPSSGWVERSCLKWSCEMRSVYRTVVVKKELSRKAKLSIYRSIYVPTLTYALVSHSGGARSRAAAPSFSIERSQLRWLGSGIYFGCPLDASLGRCSRRVPPGGGLGEDPGHAGETMSLGLAWERLGDPPGRAGGSVWGEGGLGISAQTAASATRSRTKRMKMDGWMDPLHVEDSFAGNSHRLITVMRTSSCLI
ncbi:hypothetical protein L3Q82_011825 [Scortum barcoo]|uniref:Uncharacterized protein n=1 Tax=Scortum barcoo TaxID=214431 RepID=A0ACB8W694_9TELE|nr:hypothetical protein L3Q82_011825 [Scortum barcoo]